MAAATFVLAAMAAAALPGYAQTQSKTASGSLKISLGGWENNLTPFSVTFASQPTTVDLLNLVYDTLFWSQARADPEPWLAEEANPSADRRAWTVKLRPGVQWHDGKPFTAEDVKFTFEYFRRHAARSGRYGHHLAEVPIFERGQVLSPTEVRLFFADPVPAFRTLPGADLPMLPRHIWQDVEEPTKEIKEKPVGTGPFTVAQLVEPERLTLKANPDYFKGRPLVDGMDFIVARDPNVSFNQLVETRLDLVTGSVPPIFVSQLSANPEIKVVQASRMESVQLNFNAKKQPLSDPKLRKAISLAIDNRVLLKTAAGGRGLPGVDTFVHPESAWAAPGSRHEFDVGKANQLLDSAGYSRKDSDGIRRGPDGKRLSFSALFSTLEPQSLQVLQLVSQMTTGIGVRMEPAPASPRELREVRRPQNGQGIPGYDAYISQLEVHTHSDPDGLLFFFHSPGKGMGGQITGYSNPAFDRIVEEASTTVDLPQRKQKLHEAQRILAEEVPSLVLFYPDGVYAFRPAAYDGWVPDPGQGIFTKRSFLQEYARAGGTGGKSVPISPAWLFLGGVGALVVAGSTFVLLRRRPAPAGEWDSQDPQTPPSQPEQDGSPPPSSGIGDVMPAQEQRAAQPDAEDVPDATVAQDEPPDSSAAPAPYSPAFSTPAQEPLPLPEPPRWPSLIGSEIPEPERPPRLSPQESDLPAIEASFEAPGDGLSWLSQPPELGGEGKTAADSEPSSPPRSAGTGEWTDGMRELDPEAGPAQRESD